MSNGREASSAGRPEGSEVAGAEAAGPDDGAAGSDDRAVPPLRGGRVSDRAAALLLSELTRLRGPRTALLVGVPDGCPVLAGALAALRDGDTLTVLPDTGSVEAPAAVRDQLAGELVAAEPAARDRVHVVSGLADAKPADVVIVARPLSGPAAEAAGFLADLRDTVAPGGVLVVAAAARPGDPAGAELRELADEYGVGDDLLLRHRPALRVRRLRFEPAEPAVAERLTPVARPSSVRLAGPVRLDSSGVAAAAACLAVAALARRRSRLWLVPALAAVPMAAFFRDPERHGPDDESAITAASDGRALSVDHLPDDRFGVGDGSWLRIAVFLSVLDVHINRAPVAGRVVEVRHEHGGYAPAMKPAAEHNTAAYTVLESRRGPVVVAQRTGLVARRIVQRAPAGALLARGERFGLIRFGSRTDVYLPAASATAVVAPGDTVRAATTPIALWVR